MTTTRARLGKVCADISPNGPYPSPAPAASAKFARPGLVIGAPTARRVTPPRAAGCEGIEPSRRDLESHLSATTTPCEIGRCGGSRTLGDGHIRPGRLRDAQRREGLFPSSTLRADGESRTHLARLGRPAARHEHTRAPPGEPGERSRRQESNLPCPPYHGGALPREQRRPVKKPASQGWRTGGVLGWSRTNTSAFSAQRYHRVSFEHETRRDTDGAAEWSRTTLDPSTKRVLSHESDDGNQRRITAPRRQRLRSATKGSLPRRLIESTAHDRNAESLTRRTDEAH